MKKSSVSRTSIPIALATLRNEQRYKEASEIRQKRFGEAFDKKAYQVLGNVFYLKKEYHDCRKLAQGLWKGLRGKFSIVVFLLHDLPDANTIVSTEERLLRFRRRRLS